jgi:glycine betaine/proline transport system substrate-binding protein
MTKRLRGGVVIAAAASLLLTACGSASTTTPAATDTASATTAACDSFSLAINPWVGYEANAAVIKYVAEKQLGCTVTTKNISEQVAWQGFATGEIDAVVENWGHDDLVKKDITDQKVAVDFGATGNEGIIGWYLPPWMVAKYPDIADSANLNKYASLFKTSESGNLGQFSDGDPAYVTNDEALMKNLKLNFKVVYLGSEAALIQGFRNAEAQKKPFIGYFYEPQWFLAEVPLVHVKLPAYTPGCDAVAAKVACDYPPYHLNKVVSKKFADSGSPAVKLLQNFNWTNDDQNTVAKYITVDKMTDEAAAAKWVAANQAKVDAWLK